MAKPVSPPSTSRFDTLDALRGGAMVWMTVFHFCFDLNHFGYLRQNFYQDPFWTWQRTAIVSLFLLCAGMGQAVALTQQQSWSRFWRRWAQIAGCAVLVSAGSYWMYPNSFIYFGVLHGLALMLLIARLSARWGRWLWPLGALAMAAPWVALQTLDAMGVAELLNQKSLNWLGLITRRPVTEDYVPVLPWLGVMWWGMAAGTALLRTKPFVLTRAVGRIGRGLAWLGRWSLSYYMLHQPVMLGLLAVFGAVVR
ncbi:heparan-alpha-glucosaminide N-acetyltransferase [Rhodoferax sp.]|uniref:heparan-alpha-glucosaminide N-acetyltransferase n=1 Tax=Rhodoferax sp. TaxID=50421 RepID=UPI002756DB79|nr:heparan-alpha-glucosaminide N-acetyltransferase [Rhodoferax sp.]